MLMAAITQPSFTYITFSFFLCNLILEKNPFCCLMLKVTKKFELWVLDFLLLVLLLVLFLLLEGACALTPLPTKTAQIRGTGKSEAKCENDLSWNRSGFKVFFFSLASETQEETDSKKKPKKANVTGDVQCCELQCCRGHGRFIALQAIMSPSSWAPCSATSSKVTGTL